MRKIIHIDMDCFYAAVEMRDNPHLASIPMAVGGRHDRRGVISTANYIARRFGIHSAMPVAQALKRCPHLTLIPARMDVYKATSRQINAIFRRYTSIIEPLSLDEAYLDVTDCTMFKGSATLIAQDIRAAIYKELRLTASAGVASLKFLAKIASDINKPNGQYVISPQQINDFLADLPLSTIAGVGKVTQEKLAEFGLHTCGDIQQYNLTLLLKHFGKFGRILYERCNGIDARDVYPQRQRKSVGVETTLTQDIDDWESCRAIIERLYPQLEQRLAKVQPHQRIARQGVKLKFNDFQLTTQEHVWSHLDRDDFVNVAQALWQTRRHHRGVRLVGLHVTLLDPQKERQLPLFY